MTSQPSSMPLGQALVLSLELGRVVLWPFLVEDASGFGFQPVDFIEADDIKALEIVSGIKGSVPVIDNWRLSAQSGDVFCRAIFVPDSQTVARSFLPARPPS